MPGFQHQLARTGSYCITVRSSLLRFFPGQETYVALLTELQAGSVPVPSSEGKASEDEKLGGGKT